MKMAASDSAAFFLFQPVTGFASIAFGYPKAPWGAPQTPAEPHWLILFEK